MCAAVNLKLFVNFNDNLLGISSENLDRITESLDQVVQSLATLHNVLGLTESISNGSVCINSHVQVTLQVLLRLFDQEKANLLRDRVSDVSHYNSVIIIDSAPQLLHKSFRIVDLLLWLIVGVILLGDRVSILIEFGRLALVVILRRL